MMKKTMNNHRKEHDTKKIQIIIDTQFKVLVLMNEVGLVENSEGFREFKRRAMKNIEHLTKIRDKRKLSTYFGWIKKKKPSTFEQKPSAPPSQKDARVHIDGHTAYIYDAKSKESLEKEMLKLNKKGFNLIESNVLDYGYRFNYYAKMKISPDFQ